MAASAAWTSALSRSVWSGEGNATEPLAPAAKLVRAACIWAGRRNEYMLRAMTGVARALWALGKYAPGGAVAA